MRPEPHQKLLLTLVPAAGPGTHLYSHMRPCQFCSQSVGLPTSAADLTSHSLAWLQAQTLRLAAQPVAAACCHLSVDDPTRAVVALLGGGEWEMAHALAHALPVPEALQHETRHQLALACEAAGMSTFIRAVGGTLWSVLDKRQEPM